MVSTLIKRICDPEQMTEAEKASVMSEMGYTTEAQLKLGLHSCIGVLLEVRKGRLPSVTMKDWLTIAEYADALVINTAVSNGTFEHQEIWELCLLAEYGTYTCPQVEGILGL